MWSQLQMVKRWERIKTTTKKYIHGHKPHIGLPTEWKLNAGIDVWLTFYFILFYCILRCFCSAFSACGFFSDLVSFVFFFLSFFQCFLCLRLNAFWNKFWAIRRTWIVIDHLIFWLTFQRLVSDLTHWGNNKYAS